ncbi:MAG: hypothetical protein EPN47_11370 [Acidobacteria bacterium]|nr:MAG: hypothetical protein EPN47_11370 [Acidobacteriota bacterium]
MGKNTGPSHPLDVNATVRYLRENGFDCYVLGIASTPPYSFSDLKRLLPALHGTGISVWAELFPPSEPAVQLPFNKDYVKWMEVLGQLSRQYAELRGVNIDDYLDGVSSKTFTRPYTCRIYRAEKQADPNLLFAPTIYELDSEAVNRLFGCVDGVWFWWTNLGNNGGMRTLLENSRAVVAGRFSVYAGVYAHSTSWHQAAGPRPTVLKEALETGCQYSDGDVMWNVPFGPDQSDNPLLTVSRSFGVGGTASLAAKCGTITHRPPN